MSPPSRRTVLRTCGLAVVGGLAGCNGGQDDRRTADDRDTPGTDGPKPTPDQPTGDPDGATLVLESEYEDAVTVRVRVLEDGNRLVDEEEAISPKESAPVAVDVPQPGEYTVEVGFGEGTLASHDWTVGDAYDGSLVAIVTAERDIVFGERLDESMCSAATLPYSAPDERETVSPSSATLRNESGQAITVELSIAHSGETFVSCTQALEPRQRVDIEPLTATAGVYTVTVDVSGGGQTIYDWRIPDDHNWPSLSVTVPRDSDPVVGCGTGGDIRVSIENTTSRSQTTALSLRRDGKRVATDTVDAAAETTTETSLSTPVGDFYTLVAATNGGETRTEVVECSCYRTGKVIVALDGSGPEVDGALVVCD